MTKQKCMVSGCNNDGVYPICDGMLCSHHFMKGMKKDKDKPFKEKKCPSCKRTFKDNSDIDECFICKK